MVSQQTSGASPPPPPYIHHRHFPSGDTGNNHKEKVVHNLISKLGWGLIKELTYSGVEGNKLSEVVLAAWTCSDACSKDLKK
jgi:hypothetical protein